MKLISKYSKTYQNIKKMKLFKNIINRFWIVEQVIASKIKDYNGEEFVDRRGFTGCGR